MYTIYIYYIYKYVSTIYINYKLYVFHNIYVYILIWNVMLTVTVNIRVTVIGQSINYASVTVTVTVKR